MNRKIKNTVQKLFVPKTTRLAASILLVVTILPVCLRLGYDSYFAYKTLQVSSVTFQQILTRYDLLNTVHKVLGYWTLIVFLGYVILVYKLPVVPQGKRLGWVLSIVFFNVLALLVFWYRYIWQYSTKGSASSPS